MQMHPTHWSTSGRHCLCFQSIFCPLSSSLTYCLQNLRYLLLSAFLSLLSFISSVCIVINYLLSISFFLSTPSFYILHALPTPQSVALFPFTFWCHITIQYFYHSSKRFIFSNYSLAFISDPRFTFSLFILSFLSFCLYSILSIFLSCLLSLFLG